MDKGSPRDICDRTFEFARRIVRLCQRLDEGKSAQRTLSRQILRAGTSIGANVEEAQGSQSPADFVSKCSIALKEARETRYWLRLIAAESLVEPALLDSLIQEADELVKILTTIIVRTKENRLRH